MFTGIEWCWKSTTMKAIMRLVPISKGKILVDGEPITQQNINKMAYIPDIPIHDLGWTIPQNLSFAQVFYKNFNLEKAERMLKFSRFQRIKN